MDLFEHLGTVLKPHAALVSKGADSEQATQMVFLANEESYLNLIQLPRLEEERSGSEKV